MIFVILVAAVLFRIIALNQSLWLDEAININNAIALDFKTLILNYSLGDFHPPLYHAILKGWIIISEPLTRFIDSEAVFRIPSIIFGVLTVFVTYLIAKKLYEKKTALIAATLMATAPLHIYYSQEARMYALAAFLASASVYFFISLVKKDTLGNWVGFMISTTLMLYSDYLPYLLLPTYVLFLFINRKRIPPGTLKSFVPAYVLVFILLIPWLLIFPDQIKGGLSAASSTPAWAKVVGSTDAKSFVITFVKFTIGRISHDNNLIYALIFAPVALYISFLSALSILRQTSARSFLWFWFAVPIIAAFVLSFFIPVFAYFRLLFVLPALYIILASAINIVNWPKLTRILLLLALAINMTAATIYFTNPKFHREHWKEAVSFVSANSSPTSVALFEAGSSMAPFDFYNNGQIEAKGAINGLNAKPEEVEVKVKEATKGKTKVFLFQYLTQITDPQGLVFKELSRQGFVNTGTKDFSGVGFVYVFEK
ncbi:MAG: glycosyltransferase family 39 protein [Candidatus Curtissbacteria bacterium]|nr:glycosyltransferase family 39 protein [Candidatus Curtissbacteria bacterium]